MLVLRLFLLFMLITVGIAVLAYLFTRNKKYLRFTWQIVRFAVIFLAVFAVLFILERLVLI
jgi:hypothetical protein